MTGLTRSPMSVGQCQTQMAGSSLAMSSRKAELGGQQNWRL